MALFTFTLDMYKGPRVGEPVYILLLVGMTFSCWFFLGLHEKLGYHLTVGLDFLCTTALVLLAAWLGRRYLEPLGGALEKGLGRIFPGGKSRRTETGSEEKR